MAQKIWVLFSFVQLICCVIEQAKEHHSCFPPCLSLESAYF